MALTNDKKDGDGTSGGTPIRTGLSQIEKEFSSINSGSAQAPSISSSGFANMKQAFQPMAQPMPQGGGQTPSQGQGGFPAIKELLGDCGFGGGCGQDPEQQAVYDDLLGQARDMAMLSSNQTKPQYGPAGPAGVLPHQAYYPNANDNIVKGYVQGSRIGSNPIFAAAGGLVPVGIWDANKRVLQNTAARKAASAKEKKIDPMDFDPIEADARYQETIRSYWWKHEEKIMNDAFREYGTLAEDVVNNPNSTYGMRRKKLHEQLSSIGDLTTELTTTFTDKLKAMKEGDETATQADQDRMEEYMTGMAEELDRLSPEMTDKEISGVIKALNGRSVAANQHMNMIGIYNDYAKNLKTRITEGKPQLLPLFTDTDEDGDPWTPAEKQEAMVTWTKEEVDKEQIAQMQMEIWNTPHLRRSIGLSDPRLSEEEQFDSIRKALEARLPTKTTNQASRVPNGSGSSGWLGSKKYSMEPVNIANVPENLYHGDVMAAYEPLNLKGGTSSGIKWNIRADDQAYFPGMEDGEKWYGLAGMSLTLESPQLVHSSVQINGKTIEGWFVNGTTSSTPSDDDRERDMGVFDKTKEMLVSIPIHVGPEGRKELGWLGGNSGLHTLSNSLGVKPQNLQFWLENNGKYPEEVVDANGNKFKIKPDANATPGAQPEYEHVGKADGTENVRKTVTPEVIEEPQDATSPLDSAAVMNANIARLDSAITDWTSPLPVDENGMVSPYKEFKLPEGSRDIPSKIKEDKGYEKAWWGDSERRYLPKDLKIDAYVDELLQFEHDYGTVSGGKAVGLEGINPEQDIGIKNSRKSIGATKNSQTKRETRSED